MTSTITVGDIVIANDAPMVLIGGLNVLESEALALEVAETFSEVCKLTIHSLYLQGIF